MYIYIYAHTLINTKYIKRHCINNKSVQIPAYPSNHIYIYMCVCVCVCV